MVCFGLALGEARFEGSLCDLGGFLFVFSNQAKPEHLGLARGQIEPEDECRLGAVVLAIDRGSLALNKISIEGIFGEGLLCVKVLIQPFEIGFVFGKQDIVRDPIISLGWVEEVASERFVVGYDGTTGWLLETHPGPRLLTPLQISPGPVVSERQSGDDGKLSGIGTAIGHEDG